MQGRAFRVEESQGGDRAIRLGGGKRTVNELQRLQAEYARAYNRLERHAKNCAMCKFAAEFDNEDERGDTQHSTRTQISA